MKWWKQIHWFPPFISGHLHGSPIRPDVVNWTQALGTKANPQRPKPEIMGLWVFHKENIGISWGYRKDIIEI